MLLGKPMKIMSCLYVHCAYITKNVAAAKMLCPPVNENYYDLMNVTYMVCRHNWHLFMIVCVSVPVILLVAHTMSFMPHMSMVTWMVHSLAILTIKWFFTFKRNQLLRHASVYPLSPWNCQLVLTAQSA